MNRTLAAALAAVVFASSAAEAALINSYDFDLGLGDTLGAGATLTANGGTVAGGTYTFLANQGLRLTGALPSTTDFGIELRVRVDDSTGGYNKLIDFQDLASDIGLYVLGGQIDFYTAGPSAGTVPLGTFVIVGLARAGGTITAFLDGMALFSVADGGQAVSASNILNFFRDDNATGGGEAFAGTVDFIRIHNDSSTFGQVPVVSTVPVPASLPMLFAGLGLLGLLRRAGSRRRA